MKLTLKYRPIYDVATASWHAAYYSPGGWTSAVDCTTKRSAEQECVRLNTEFTNSLAQQRTDQQLRGLRA